MQGNIISGTCLFIHLVSTYFSHFFLRILRLQPICDFYLAELSTNDVLVVFEANAAQNSTTMN